jgi:hypothetical protein
MIDATPLVLIDRWFFLDTQFLLCTYCYVSKKSNTAYNLGRKAVLDNDSYGLSREMLSSATWNEMFRFRAALDGPEASSANESNNAALHP